MSDVIINIIKRNKDSLIKLVKPHFICNRFDLLYDNKYELLELEYQSNKYYVPVHTDLDVAYLGISLSPIPEEVFNALVEYIFKFFPCIDKIEIKHSLNKYSTLKNTDYCIVDLPNTEEEYLNSLGKKTKLHIKQYFKYIYRDFDCEFKVYNNNIPSIVVEAYFKFKKDTINFSYKLSCQEYLKKYQVTKACVLYLNNKIAAVSFVSELPPEDSKEVYFENFSYDSQYAKYSLGTVIFFYTVKILISNGFDAFYLGGGVHV